MSEPTNEPTADATTASIAMLSAMIRELPLADARDFLHGLLPIMAECEAVHSLRSAYMQLNQCDWQLELLAGTQGRLL